MLHGLQSASSRTYLALFTLLLLAIAPYPLASNRPLPLAFLGLFAGVILLLSLFRSQPVRLFKSKTIIAAGILYGLAVCWGFIQALPSDLTGFNHPVWQLADQAAGPVEERMSLRADTKNLALILMLLAAAMFYLGVLTGAQPQEARSCFQGLIVIVSIYSVLGLLMFLTGFKLLEALPEQKHVTSTFVNRNHFASYANMGFLISLAWFTSLKVRHQNPLLTFLTLIEKKPLSLCLLLMMGAAILASQSRGGLLSLCLGTLTYLVIKYGRTTGVKKITVPALAILSLASIVILAGGPLLERFSDLSKEISLTEGGRLSAWQNTLQLISLAPLTGHGLGTYSDLFLTVGDVRFNAHFDHAHNDYLEVLTELGLIFGLCLIAAPALLLWRCASLTIRYQSRQPLCGLLAGIAVGTHAMTDFVTTIPAIVVTVSFVLGLSCAFDPKRDKQSQLVLDV